MSLENLRTKIDSIDEEILQLLDERMQTSVAIGKAKQEKGQPVFDAVREIALFTKLLQMVKGKTVSQTAVLKIYLNIVKASRALQGSEQNLAAAKKIYAVLGHPVGHSLSPLMFNTAFAFADYAGVYLALDTENIEQTMCALKDLSFGGASVTIPHKASIMAYLDEVDAAAQAIGAVNTVVNRAGRLVGYNTDSLGAMAALKEKTSIPGKTCLVLGTGGAAKAIVYGLMQAGAHVINYGRKDILGGNFPTCDILVNTTPVGMYPNINEMVVPANMLKQGMVVMDIVYNPLQTKLLQAAQKAGCVTVSGVEMFISQGAAQYELWTGTKAPIEIMRGAVLGALERK